MNQPPTQPKTTQLSSTQQTLVATHPASAPAARPAHAEIAKRAYEIYLKKGRQQGQCEQNWLQAEQELRKQATPAFQATPSGNRPIVARS
jgi:hypothetical protein